MTAGVNSFGRFRFAVQGLDKTVGLINEGERISQLMK